MGGGGNPKKNSENKVDLVSTWNAHQDPGRKFKNMKKTKNPEAQAASTTKVNVKNDGKKESGESSGKSSGRVPAKFNLKNVIEMESAEKESGEISGQVPAKLNLKNVTEMESGAENSGENSDKTL